MKCNHCEREVSEGSIIPGWGVCCKGKCTKEVQAKRKAYHDELKAEGINQAPEAFETADFERFALKFAVCWLDTTSVDDREKLCRINPMLLVPEELALDFKDRILRHIKPCYVSSVEHRGHDRLFSGGTYCFRRPVPSEHIIEAMRAAQLLA